MPNWTDTPPADNNVYAFRILRTPAEKPITATITSDNLVGTFTHFAHHRTVPCEGQDECEWCKAGHSRRWHGYIGAVLHQGLEHALIELTQSAAETLHNYRQAYGTLRGCAFTAYRPSKRINGRVVVQCKRGSTPDSTLPAELDLRSILCHIWNVATTKTTATTRVVPGADQLRVNKSKSDGRYRTGAPVG